MSLHNSLLRRLLTGIWLLLLATFASAQTTTGFRPDPNGAVHAVAWQADGRMLIAGDFTQVDGVPAQRIARLRADGSIDPTFSVNIVGGGVRALVIEPNGRIVLAGDFSHIGPTARARLARINPDGTLDATFNPSTNALVHALVRQTNGKLVVAGNFTQVAGQSRAHIARLNADGSLDPSFLIQANDLVLELHESADGRLLMGGNFTSINGVTRNRIARLNVDGTLDDIFNPDASGSVDVITTTPGGTLYIGGTFATVGGHSAIGFARLKSSGVVDPLSSRPNAPVTALAVQADGKLLVGGVFSSFGGQTRNFIARLDVGGTLDTEFSPTSGNQVTLLAEQADGRVIVGGGFSTFAGKPRSRLARVEPEGTLDDTFALALPTQRTIFGIAVQADRRVILGGSLGSLGVNSVLNLARLRYDGTLDNTFFPTSDGLLYAVAAGESSTLGVGRFDVMAGQSCSGVARVLANATLDPSFNACSVPGEIVNLLPLRDGRFLIAGGFDSVAGQPRSNLARLASNGQLDATFTSSTDGVVRALAEQSDGKLLIGGDFATIAGANRQRLSRLQVNGQIDASFSASANGKVYTIVIQPNGRILVGGEFTTINGQARPGIARLLANGSLDPTFVPAPLPASDITTILLQASGDLIIRGNLLLEETNEYVLRLRSDGSLDAGFRLSMSASTAIAQHDDGRLLVAGNFLPGGSALMRVNLPDENVDKLTIQGSTITWQRSGAIPELSAAPVLQISTNRGDSFSTMATMQRVGDNWQLANVDIPIGPTFLLRAQAPMRSGVVNGSTGVAQTTARFQRLDGVFRNGFE